jgi:hypothetical protein
MSKQASLPFPYSLSFFFLKNFSPLKHKTEIWYRNSFALGYARWGKSDLDISFSFKEQPSDDDLQSLYRFYSKAKRIFPWLGETNTYLPDDQTLIKKYINIFELSRDPIFMKKQNMSITNANQWEKAVFLTRMIASDEKNLHASPEKRSGKWNFHLKQIGETKNEISYDGLVKLAHQLIGLDEKFNLLKFRDLKSTWSHQDTVQVMPYLIYDLRWEMWALLSQQDAKTQAQLFQHVWLYIGKLREHIHHASPEWQTALQEITDDFKKIYQRRKSVTANDEVILWKDWNLNVDLQDSTDGFFWRNHDATRNYLKPFPSLFIRKSEDIAKLKSGTYLLRNSAQDLLPYAHELEEKADCKFLVPAELENVFKGPHFETYKIARLPSFEQIPHTLVLPITLFNLQSDLVHVQARIEEFIKKSTSLKQTKIIVAMRMDVFCHHTNVFGIFWELQGLLKHYFPDNEIHYSDYHELYKLPQDQGIAVFDPFHGHVVADNWVYHYCMSKGFQCLDIPVYENKNFFFQISQYHGLWTTSI